MELTEAKNKFLHAWGTLGTNWGITRTMAQVHALLLVSDDGLSTEDIMTELQISRGNANMNIRLLVDWGLIHKQLKAGDRKEYFIAEKDIWKVSRMIARERRKRELEPAMKILEELKGLKDNSSEGKAFKKITLDIYEYVSMADQLLNKYIHQNTNWFLKLFSSIIK